MEGRVFGEGVDAREFPSYRVRELYHHSVALVTKDMIDAGLDIVVDGGQYYENETNYELAEHHHVMAHRLEGYLPYGDRFVAALFDLPIYKPTVVGPVQWRRPILKPIIEAVRAATDKPFKLHAGIGPVTLAVLSTDRHYNDMKALALDLGRAFNAEFKDAAARGADMIQVAEPLVFFEPEDWIIETINTAFEGVPARRVVHICYGHEEGQPGLLELMAGRVFPWAFDIDCDMFHIEMASHDFAEVEAFKGWPKEKDLAVGVLDGKDLRVEDPQKIAGWLRKVIDFVPPEQLCAASDCALASLRQVVAKKKISSLVEGVKIVRSELTGRK
jgi:5-methyltetrahydropteroyltriglutamate--homocysteine methyltransferase